MTTYTNFSSIIKNIDESDNAQNILSSNDVRLVDNIIELSSTTSGSSPTLDGGVSINRGSLAAANMIFKEDVDQWVCGVSGEEKQIARLTTPANNSITFFDATSQSLKTSPLITIDNTNTRVAIGKTNPTEKLTVYSSENTEDCITNIETTQSMKSAILRIGNTFALTSTSNAGNAVLQFCNGKTGDLIRNNFFIGYDTGYMDNYLAMPLTIGSMGDSTFGNPSASGTKTNIVRFFQNGVSVFGPLNANQISSHFNVKNPNSDTDVACFYNSSNVPVVIDKNSNLGLNVEFPTERLDVSGNGKFSGNLTISGTSTSTNSIVNGNFSIGTSTALSKFHLSGNMLATVGNLEYPTVALSGLSTTISGQSYGNGVYVCSSSTNVTNFDSFKAFDKSTTTYWSSSTSAYSTGDGSYLGSNSITYNTNQTYSGEWLSITLPTQIRLQSFSITAVGVFSTSRAPQNFRIFGSNDNGSTWFSIGNEYINETYTLGQTKTYTVNSSTAYSTYRIVINKRDQTTTSTGAAQITEWRLFGSSSTISTLNENVGIGSFTPSSKLEVVGNISAQFGNDTTRIIGMSGFGAGKTGVIMISETGNQIENTYGDSVKIKGFNGIQLYNGSSNELCRFGTNSSSSNCYFNGSVSMGANNQLAQLSIVGQNTNYDSSIIDETGLGLIGMYKELSFSAKNLPWYMGVGDGNSDTSRFVLLSSDTGLGNKPVVHVGFQRLEARMYIRGSIHMTATDQAMKIPTVANSSLAGLGNTAGFMLLNTTTNTISINDGTAWRNLVCSNNQFLTNLYYPTPKSVSLPNSGVRRIDLGSGQSLNSVGSSNWVANGQYGGFKYVGSTTTNIAKIIIDFYQSNEVTNQTINFSVWKNGNWSGTSYTDNASELAQTITTFPSTVGYQHCSISFLINGLTQNDIFHLGFSLASGTADKLFYFGQAKITCDVSI